MVITGEIGAGKTTLMHVLMQKVPKEVVTAVLTQTSLLPIEFLRRVCDEFEIKPAGPDKASLLDAFHSYLLNQYAAGRRVVLMIDESTVLQVIQEREGLGGLLHTPDENDEQGGSEILERMEHLEARIERA